VSPTSDVICFIMTFIAMILWGYHPIMRRMASDVPGQAYTLWLFGGEFITMLFMCLIFGLPTSHPTNSWITSTNALTAISDSFHNTNVVYIVLGGIMVGMGDFCLTVVLSRVPASIGFPIVCGLCMVTGTLLTFFIVGSDSPELLFSGLTVGFCAVLTLAYGQSLDSNTSPDSYDFKKEIEIPTKETGAGCLANEINGTKASEINIWWIFATICIGLINSGWSPMSTIGRSDSGGIKEPYAAYFAFTLGRACLSQPPAHIIYLFTFPKMKNSFTAALEVDRSTRIFACIQGAIISIGYHSFFITTEVLNAASVFSILSCCPLVTMLAGILFLGELEQYSIAAKKIMALATVLYVVALILLSLSF